MTIKAFPTSSCGRTRARMAGEYPSEVRQCAHGMCLVATMDLPPGAVVEKFEGQIVPKNQVPEDAVRYVVIWDESNMMIPETPAQFSNHSCDPNSYMNDFLELVTMRPVKRGEEITFSYNWIYEGRQDAAWDDRWSFECKCGSPRCQGHINKYIPHPSDGP
jgi:hypothetical protein